MWKIKGVFLSAMNEIHKWCKSALQSGSARWFYTCQGAQAIIPSELGTPRARTPSSHRVGRERRGAHRTATCQVTWEAEPGRSQLHNDVPMPKTTHHVLDTIKNMSGQAVAADCGENTPPQCKVLAACKSEAAISLQCAAGICTKANPKCFVTLLSSNPVSISGHPINRIRKRLKVGTGPARPREQVLRGQMQPPPAAKPHAAACKPQGSHHHRNLGWPELQTELPMFSITTRGRGCVLSPLLPLHSLCAVNGWSKCSTAVRAFHARACS